MKPTNETNPSNFTQVFAYRRDYFIKNENDFKAIIYKAPVLMKLKSF